MKIVFVQFLYYEYLGVMYLSAALKREGHEVEVFICPSGGPTEAFTASIASARPGLVGFSIMTGNEASALSLARQLKARLPVYTVFGGPHPTAVPEIIADDAVDCVCLGEAEAAVTAIARVVEAGGLPALVPGAWCKVRGEVVRNEAAPPAQDLASLARPDRSLYRDKYRALRIRRAGFLSGRGCPYSCTFCANAAMLDLYRGKGSFVRRRPVGDVIDELREAVAAYRLRSVYFEDDTFVLDRRWLLEFCESYRREIGLAFSCHIRADVATEETISALARAGCRLVSFGIETGNSLRRAEVLKKGVTDEQIIACASLLRKHGIPFRTLNILGLPGETLENAFETVDLNTRLRPAFPWCGLYLPLPGTELEAQCREQGLLPEAGAGAQPSFFSGASVTLKNKDEIVNLQKLFFFAVRFPRFRPLIRSAVRLRPNAVFDLLFVLAQGWMFLRRERISFAEMVRIGLHNVSRYLPGRVRTGGAGTGNQ